jgi:hypothetical protein
MTISIPSTRRFACICEMAETARKTALVVLAGTTIALASGCSDTSNEKAQEMVSSRPAITNATDPRWVAQANPRNKVVLVFVHGIFGDTLDTWSLGNGKPTFFKILGAVPDVGPKLDMFAFGFTSQMFKGGSLDIREAANKLHQSLQFAKVLE